MICHSYCIQEIPLACLRSGFFDYPKERSHFNHIRAIAFSAAKSIIINTRTT
ncbi:hypothetical protein QUA44_00365 [Microcoleus sp. N9_A2]|uniref:hypothetical protein n=1 Tax=unclassified Microcoleus TaxID=2642155 RepID=UPI002FCEFED9